MLSKRDKEMCALKLKYGTRELPVNLSDLKNPTIDIYSRREWPGGGPGEDTIIARALENPEHSQRIQEIFRPGERICIITSDATRPMPTRKVLPHVIGRLIEAGVRKSDILVVFALGIHRGQSEEEREALMGEQYATELLHADSDPADTVDLGHTPRGTPVHVTRSVASADRIICLGNVEFHYFAGYSGGLKAILPGVCNEETVTANHAMMLDPGATTGNLENNPLRDDIDSVGELLTVDFIVNVVLDDEKRIRYAAAGHPVRAHRAACRYVDEMNRVRVRKPAGLVLASAGGHPKDLNLYQAQKALDNAARFAAAGAPIILVAECEEGYGNSTFERWLREAGSAAGIADRLGRDFELGGHKAYALTRITSDHPVGLVSCLPPGDVHTAFMQPVSVGRDGELTIPEEFRREAARVSGGRVDVAVLPEAGSILPQMQ